MFRYIVSFPYQLTHFCRCTLNFKQQKLPRPVISVGNISFGGTGKTPVTIALAKYFAKSGLKVAVLTRGYKSKPKNNPLIVNSADKNKISNLDVYETGDEAMEMLEAFSLDDLDVIVGIDAKRYRAGEKILETNDVDLFILDDGMQHIALHRDIEILLKNFNESGLMREFPIAEKKADYIIHTKVNEKWLNQNKDKYSAVFNLSLNKKLDYEKAIGVFTGIADYQSLILMLEEFLKKDLSSRVIMPIKLINFPDHHYFALDEVTQALSLGINIITTRKDLVKIPEQYRSEFFVADLELEFLPKNFLSDLLKRVESIRGDWRNARIE